jgi:hypothetical protein
VANSFRRSAKRAHNGGLTSLLLADTRVSGELFTAKRNTPGYKLSFQVIEGEHARRRFWHDLWLTEAAMPMTKRDLLKIGVKSVEQLEQPLPVGIRSTQRLDWLDA